MEGNGGNGGRGPAPAGAGGSNREKNARPAGSGEWWDDPQMRGQRSPGDSDGRRTPSPGAEGSDGHSGIPTGISHSRIPEFHIFIILLQKFNFYSNFTPPNSSPLLECLSRIRNPEFQSLLFSLSTSCSAQSGIRKLTCISTFPTG